jgi:pyruvate/2-oxoglutarate dehydrogenase complex dihydrolipoamide dehydrogenase (E3) component
MQELAVDLCVIGGGAAGLSATSLAAQLGARVVLVERADMGGECLNSGCVPSKALLAAAKAAHAMRSGARFGIAPVEPAVDFAAVRAHVRQVIDTIAPHDSVERFEGLGARVIRAEARFTGPRMIVAGEQRIRARRVVIAAGSGPATPKIPGLDTVRFFTNETIFGNETLPEHLLVVGGGPIGIEMAQAHRRLGSRVTVLDSGRVLPRDDPELAGRLLRLLAGEGVVFREHVEIVAASGCASGVALTVREHGRTSVIEGSHLLIAAGRKPRLASLDLGKAGVRFSDGGIVVDRKLRTSATGVFAIGDVVAGAPRFTHIAGYHAGIAVQNALLFPFAKTSYEALPWVTYCDPELAQVGASEADARRTHGDDVRVLTVEMTANDRAQTELATAGAVKLVAHRSGRVLGVSILDAHAGELAHVWGLAIRSGTTLKNIARSIAPYPTRSEANKAAAAEFYRPKLFSDLSRRMVRLFSHLA